ncbi:MAG: hypothetical protein E5X61_22655, partial [Mesorhizobium sp.]
PGTVGAGVGVALAAVLISASPWLVVLAYMALFAVGVWASSHVISRTGTEDPQIVVIDETFGTAATLSMLAGSCRQAVRRGAGPDMAPRPVPGTHPTRADQRTSNRRAAMPQPRRDRRRDAARRPASVAPPRCPAPRRPFARLRRIRDGRGRYGHAGQHPSSPSRVPPSLAAMAHSSERDRRRGPCGPGG